jgi:hypothetical protein
MSENQENGLKGYTTLKEVVLDVINGMGKRANMQYYYRFLQFAIRGYKKLNLFHIPMGKVAYLAVSDLNTATLPADFLSFLYIGVPYKGRVWTFTKDQMLVSPDSIDCGADVIDTDEGEGVVKGSTGALSGYGIAGGVNDVYFKMDQANNRIIINGIVPNDKVTLSYVSTGISMSETTFIPKIAEEALIAFVHWQRVQYDDDVAMNMKKDYEDQYNKCVNEIEYATMPTLDELYDAVYSAFYQSAKR